MTGSFDLLLFALAIPTIPFRGNFEFILVQCFILHVAPIGMAVPPCGITNRSATAEYSDQSGEGDRIGTTYPLCD